MRYKNTKTGVIIDVPCRINGGDWVKYTADKKVEKPVQKTEGYVEEEVDLEEMTKAQLIEFAKEQEIEVNEKDKKAVIIEVIAKEFE